MFKRVLVLMLIGLSSATFASDELVDIGIGPRWGERLQQRVTQASRRAAQNALSSVLAGELYNLSRSAQKMEKPVWFILNESPERLHYIVKRRTGTEDNGVPAKMSAFLGFAGELDFMRVTTEQGEGMISLSELPKLTTGQAGVLVISPTADFQLKAQAFVIDIETYTPVYTASLTVKESL